MFKKKKPFPKNDPIIRSCTCTRIVSCLQLWQQFLKAKHQQLTNQTEESCIQSPDMHKAIMHFVFYFHPEHVHLIYRIIVAWAVDPCWTDINRVLTGGGVNRLLIGSWWALLKIFIRGTLGEVQLKQTCSMKLLKFIQCNKNQRPDAQVSYVPSAAAPKAPGQ